MHLNGSPEFVFKPIPLRFGPQINLDQLFRDFGKSEVDFHILVFFQTQNRFSQHQICFSIVLIRFATFFSDFFLSGELIVSTFQNFENLMWISPILVLLQLDPTSRETRMFVCCNSYMVVQ